MSEKQIENRIRKHCKFRGLLTLKLSVLGMRGWPDLTIFAPRGRVFFIEVKAVAHQDRTSVQQDYWLKTLKDLGFKAEVFSCSEEASAAIDCWIRET